MPGYKTYEDLYQSVAANKPGLTVSQFQQDMSDPQKSNKLYENIKASNPENAPYDYKDFVEHYGFNKPMSHSSPAQVPEHQWVQHTMPSLVEQYYKNLEEENSKKTNHFLDTQGITKKGKNIVPDDVIDKKKKDYFTQDLVSDPSFSGAVGTEHAPVIGTGGMVIPHDQSPEQINSVADKVNQYYNNILKKSDYNYDEGKKLDQQNANLVKQIQEVVPGWKPSLDPKEWAMYDKNSSNIYQELGKEIQDLEAKQPSKLDQLGSDISGAASLIGNVIKSAGNPGLLAAAQAQQQHDDPVAQLEQAKSLRKTFSKMWLLGQKPTEQELGSFSQFIDNIKAGFVDYEYQTKEQFNQNRNQLMTKAVAADIVYKNPNITADDLAEKTTAQVKKYTTPTEFNLLNDNSISHILMTSGGQMLGSMPAFLAASAVGGEAANLGKWTERMTTSASPITRMMGNFAKSTLTNAIPMSYMSKDKGQGLAAGYAFGAAGDVSKLFGGFIDGKSYGGAMKVMSKAISSSAIHGASAATAMTAMHGASVLMGNSPEFENDLEKEGAKGVFSKEAKEWLANTILYGMLPLATQHEYMRKSNILKTYAAEAKRQADFAPYEQKKAAQEIVKDANEVASHEPNPVVEPIIQSANKNPSKPAQPNVANSNGKAATYKVPLGVDVNNVHEEVVPLSSGQSGESNVMLGDNVHTISGKGHETVFALRTKENNGIQLNPEEITTLARLTGQDPQKVLGDMATQAESNGNKAFAEQLKKQSEAVTGETKGEYANNKMKLLVKNYAMALKRNVPNNDEVNNARQALKSFADEHGYQYNFEDDNFSVSKGEKIFTQDNTEYEVTKDGLKKLQKGITALSKASKSKDKEDEGKAEWQTNKKAFNNVRELARQEGLTLAHEDGYIVLKDMDGNVISRPDEVYKERDTYPPETILYSDSVLPTLAKEGQPLGDLTAAQVQKAAQTLLEPESKATYYTEKLMDALEAKVGEKIEPVKTAPPEPEKPNMVDDKSPTVPVTQIENWMEAGAVVPEKTPPTEDEYKEFFRNESRADDYGRTDRINKFASDHGIKEEDVYKKWKELADEQKAAQEPKGESKDRSDIDVFKNQFGENEYKWQNNVHPENSKFMQIVHWRLYEKDGKITLLYHLGSGSKSNFIYGIKSIEEAIKKYHDGDIHKQEELNTEHKPLDIEELTQPEKPRTAADIRAELKATKDKEKKAALNEELKKLKAEKPKKEPKKEPEPVEEKKTVKNEVKEKIKKLKADYKEEVNNQKKQGIKVDPKNRFMSIPGKTGKLPNPLYELAKQITEAEETKAPAQDREIVVENTPHFSPLFQALKKGDIAAFNKYLGGINPDYAELAPTVSPSSMINYLSKKGIISVNEGAALSRLLDKQAEDDLNKTKVTGRAPGKLHSGLPFNIPESEGEGLFNKGARKLAELFRPNQNFKDFLRNWKGAYSTPEEQAEAEKYLKGKKRQYLYDYMKAFYQGRSAEFLGIDRLKEADYKPGDEYVVNANNAYRNAIAKAWDYSKNDPQKFQQALVVEAMKLQSDVTTPQGKANAFVASKISGIALTAKTPEAIDAVTTMALSSVRYRLGDQLISPKSIYEKSLLDEIGRNKWEPLNDDERERLDKLIYGGPYGFEKSSNPEKELWAQKIGRWIDDFYRHPQYLYNIAKTEAGREGAKDIYRETQRGLVRMPSELQRVWAKKFVDLTGDLSKEEHEDLSKLAYYSKYKNKGYLKDNELSAGIVHPKTGKLIKPSDNTIKAYNGIVKLMQGIQDKTIEGEKLYKEHSVSTGEKDDAGEDKKALLHYDKMTPEQQKAWEKDKREDLFGLGGYFPFERKKNDNNVVIATGKDFYWGGGGDIKHYFKVKTNAEARAHAAELRKQGYKNVSIHENSSIPRPELETLSVSALHDIRDSILKGRDEDSLNPKEKAGYDMINQVMSQALARFGKGNQLKFNAVPGIEPTHDNFKESMIQMMARQATNFGVSHSKFNFEKINERIPSQDNLLKQRLKTWSDSINKKGESTGLWRALSAVTYAWRLALSPVHTARVFASTFYMTPLVLHMDNSPLFGDGYAAEHMKSIWQAMRFTRDQQGIFTAGARAAGMKLEGLKKGEFYDHLLQMQHEGTLGHTSMNQHFQGVYNQANIFDKAMNQSIANVEYFARTMTALMGLKDAKARGITDKDKMIDHATRLTFRANSNYDKTNQLLIRSKAMPSPVFRFMADAMLLFKNTHMNHNELMTEVMGDVGKTVMAGQDFKKNVGRALLASTYEIGSMGADSFFNPASLPLRVGNLVSTGLQKAPLTTSVFMLGALGAYMGLQYQSGAPNKTVDETVAEAVNKIMPGADKETQGTIADAISHGYSSFLGIDGSNWGDLGNIQVGGSGSVWDGSPTGAVASNMVKGVKAFSDGDYANAKRYLTPSFFSNPSKAISWEQKPLNISKGVTYQPQGDKVWDIMNGLQPLGMVQSWDARALLSAEEPFSKELIAKAARGKATQEDIDNFNEQLQDRIFTAFEKGKRNGASVDADELTDVINRLVVTDEKIERQSEK